MLDAQFTHDPQVNAIATSFVPWPYAAPLLVISTVNSLRAGVPPPPTIARWFKEGVWRMDRMGV